MKKTLHIEELEPRATPSGPPRIFVVLPTSGPSLEPGENALPLIGAISVGSALQPIDVPPAVQIESLGQTSNPFPFTVN